KVRLLVAHGHEVRQILFDNIQINGRNSFGLAAQTIWNHSAYKDIKQIASSWHPDVIDVDNFFPLASPSVYYAARRLRIPVIQTLHNYRLLCPRATLFRDDGPCEDCMCRMLPWPGVIHRCYRDSASASAAVSAMVTIHNVFRTWQRKVTIFIA